MKFRKKPVVIEAVKYEGDHASKVRCGLLECHPHAVRPYIDTLEGRMFVDVGDWIITGVKGERYPCKPDIFAMTYEAVDEAEASDEV